MASGTMGNLVAQLAHLARGQETIAGREHHMTIDEAAGHAVIVGTSIRALDDQPDGTLALDDIDAAFRNPLDVHEPITGLITLENTHAHSMGQPLRPAYPARSGRSPASRASPSTSMARGSGTPSSPSGRTASARGPGRPGGHRHVLPDQGPGLPGRIGRGRPQRRHLARAARPQAAGRRDAPGRHPGRRRADRPPGRAGRMIDRLADDHANARRLAEALAGLDGIQSPGGIAQPDGDRLDPGRVATNFVLFKVDRDRAAFLAALAARNVLMVEYSHGQVRAVTHHDVTAADIDTTSARCARRWPRPAT